MNTKAPSFDHPVFPITLGFVAGFVDLFGFMQWYGLLVSHVTGNLIFFAYDIARGNYQLVMKLATLPLFALFVAFATWFIRALTARDRAPFGPAVLAEAFALAASVLTGLTLPSPLGPDDIGAIVPGGLALFAMAMQNTMMRLILNNLPPTTVMTGNITHVVTEAASHITGVGVSHRAVLVAYTLSAFAFGATVGGLLQVRVGTLALLLPIVVLLALVTLFHRLVPAPEH